MDLTVVIPNRDRIEINSPSWALTMKSILWQTNKNFRLLIVDGGSKNYSELTSYFEPFDFVAVIQKELGKDFNKPLLNNYAILNAKTEYVLCTDADLMFAPNFIQDVLVNLDANCMIESRTLFWKDRFARQIYSGAIDIEKNFDACRIGRIKYRTTCGDCQCMHISKWKFLRGYDESFVGWGSEDRDLMIRSEGAGIKVKWINEDRNKVFLFHQPHSKSMEALIKDLAFQDENKKKLFTKRIVNKDGWGGIIVS